MNKLPDEIINSLSVKIKKIFSKNNSMSLSDVEEIRLRVNRPLIVYSKNCELYFNEKKQEFDLSNKDALYVTKDDIEQTFQLICKYSIHSYIEDIKKGFVTLKGGHRVGIGGKVVAEENSIKNIKNISSLNIRISREVANCSSKIIKHILKPPRKLYNTLLISPPQCGKTTIIRDLVKNISNGVKELGFEGLKVSVIDERNEIAGSYLGTPQMDIGIRTDVIEACPKDIGIMMVLRSMSPNVIVTDEIGNSKEVNALYTALNGGVSLITSVHGYNLEDIQNRRELNQLINKELFKRIIVLSGRLGPGTIEKIYDLEEKRCIFVS